MSQVLIGPNWGQWWCDQTEASDGARMSFKGRTFYSARRKQSPPPMPPQSVLLPLVEYEKGLSSRGEMSPFKCWGLRLLEVSNVIASTTNSDQKPNGNQYTLFTTIVMGYTRHASQKSSGCNCIQEQSHKVQKLKQDVVNAWTLVAMLCQERHS